MARVGPSHPLNLMVHYYYHHICVFLVGYCDGQPGNKTGILICPPSVLFYSTELTWNASTVNK